MKKTRKLFLLTLLILPMTMAAVYLFKTLDSRNRLNSSQINCILKDSRGYVWFGTPAGLYRYDGYTFKNFQCNSQDGSSLPDSYIESIQESLDGNLWIKTPTGLCIYHPQSESFERDMKQVFSKMGFNERPDILYIDQKKNLWAYVPNKGVYAFNTQQQLLYLFSYTADIKGIPEGKVTDISECREGTLIIYENGTVACCDITHQQQTLWVNHEIARQGLRLSNSLKGFADQMDNIWIYGHGTLMVYNKSTNTWDTTIGNKLGLTGNNVDRSVTGMAGDRSGNIWITTDRSGLIRMNVNTREMEPVEPHSINDHRQSAALSSMLCVYVDDTDLLWVGTEKAGVAYYGSNIYKFQSALIGDITAMAQDANGKVWYGTGDNGIIDYSGPLASQKVSALTFTKDGSMWVGSPQNGLTRILNGNTTIFSAKRDSLNTNILIDDHINALCSDKTGSLWIATNGGLQVFNPRMGSFSTYTKENGKLPTNTVTSLYYGNNNTMFVGTNEGVMKLNLSTMEHSVFTGNSTNLKKFTNDYVTQVLEDSRGMLWVGTREGVNILNLKNDSLNYITENDGLCNNCITGIEEDKNHNIWITTTNGVCRVVIQSDHIGDIFSYGLYNYDISDGLQNNEFNPGAILRKNDGNVIFGGLYGVNWVSPKGKDETNSLPRVMLTQLFIGETEILTGHEYNGVVPLPQALNESNRLELMSDHNTFAIKFAAGNYNQGERLQFMYWMEGKDDIWRNCDPLSHGVHFKDLAPGKYRLHVKAMSADGAVSRQERVLEISILRPWWQQWWMIIVYVIVIVIVVYLYRTISRRIKYIWSKKKAVIMELTRQKEELKAASDDLRQPMARMTSIIGNLTETATTLEAKEQVNSLHFQMLQIITRISEMQMALDDPETKALTAAADRLQLNDRGEVHLLENIDTELTANIRPPKEKLETQKYIVAIIDDNKDFLNFITAHLGQIYNIHTYDDTLLAYSDMEVLQPDIVVCKQVMPKMTGSELCNKVKTNANTHNIKFVLMTNGVLSAAEMAERNITVSADDYLAKPFNMQEAAMRFNRLLGLQMNIDISGVIEGQETRRLEGYSSSMTTATVSYDQMATETSDIVKALPEGIKPEPSEEEKKQQQAEQDAEGPQQVAVPGMEYYENNTTIGDYSMNNAMDQQLMRNVEQYVLQNMSRGQINLEEMSSAMGMGRVPFFHRIKAITQKTPAELVRDLKLRHACTLLEKTDINLSELAINVGFITAENFINIFKDRFGMSPLEYRLIHRKK